ANVRGKEARQGASPGGASYSTRATNRLPPMRCPECREENPAGRRACRNCGAALAIVPAPPAWDQRRRVAILAADLSGSTELGDRTKGAATRAIAGECIGALAEIIAAAGGAVVRRSADGLTALF